MANNPKIEVIISASKENFNRAIAAAKSDLNGFASEAKAVGRGINAEASRIEKASNSYKSFGNAVKIAFLGAGTAVAAFGLKSIKASAEMKQIEKGFTTMLGSATEAQKLIKELQDFAGETPFDLPGVLDGSKRLLAMGFNAKQVIPILTAVGDASAALGLGTEGINRLTLAIGQMSAKGKVSSDEMRQLTEAGIPAWDMLAKKIGVTIPQAMKMAEKGAIDSATGVQALMSSMNERYGGLMASQSQEVLGIWANLQDEMGRLAIATGNEITEAMDLKTRLGSALDFFSELRESVEKSGLKHTIIDQVPAEAFVMSAGLISAAAYAKIIPALADAAKAAQAFWASLTLGAVGGAVAAVGVGAVAGLTAYKFLDYEKYGISDEKYDNMTQIEGGESDSYKNMRETIKGQKEIRDKAQAQFRKNMGHDIFKINPPKSTPNGNSAIDNLGLKSGATIEDAGAKGSSKGANAAKAAADKIKREIDRVNESLISLEEKTNAASFSFEKMKADNYFDDLEGGAAVIGEIWRKATNEVLKMQEEVQRLSVMEQEAADLLSRAQLAGDTGQIEKAKAELDKIAALKIATEEYTAERTEQIKADSLEKETALHTQVAKTKAEIDRAYREGDVEGYIAALDEKSLAEIIALEEKQEAMQQYFDWEMESRQTLQDFMFDAQNYFKEQSAAAFADAITNGDNLAKSFANIGKNIVNMFIKWKAEQAIAALFSSKLKKKQSAETAAQGAKDANSLRPAAVYQNTISYGAASQIGTNRLILDMMRPSIGLANGGVVGPNKPVYSMIGEGRYSELVLPLGGPIFDRFASSLLGKGPGDDSVTVFFNNYGDINNAGGVEDVIEVINDTIYSGKRGA